MEPRRVYVKVSNESPYFDVVWTCYNEIILAVVAILKEEKMIHEDAANNSSSFRALAIDRYNTRIFVVFDIHNLKYNFEDAHLEGKNNLPVIAVSLSRERNHVFTASPLLMNTVNESIRRLHDINGFHGELPFREDHAKGCWPSYSEPRSCKLKQQARNT